jgi:hypothetical protein
MILPRARQEGLIIQKLHDEVLIYDQTRHKAHCLNQTAAAVWSHCDGRNSISDIARRAGKDLGAPINDAFVWSALKQLAGSKLLEDAIEVTASMKSLPRRQMMKLGLSAALAAPLIISIVAPTAMAGGSSSCRPSGASCVASAQCCSLVCVASVCA